MSKNSIQDKILPVMVVALIGAAFALGMMWGKVQVYEKGGITDTNLDLAPEEEVIVLDEEGQDALLENAAYQVGDDEAAVTIVEFTDYECPFCKSYVDETFGKIMSDYVDQGLVKYIIRDFPLGGHLGAIPAAQAARCAGDEGKYYEMHNALFSGQADWSVGEVNNIFESYAEQIDLDVDAFNNCLESEKYAAAVEADAQLGGEYGVNGTPAFFINGKLFMGAQPYEAFVDAIEEALGN